MEKEPVQQPESIEILQAPVNPSIQQLPGDLSQDFEAQLIRAAGILEGKETHQLAQASESFRMQDFAKYQTCEEAKIAARALNIKSRKDYKEKYKIDPRLPANPDGKYGNEFLGWADFLGTNKQSWKERSNVIYQTCEEAKVAARALKFKTSSDYKEKYKIDPRLPANPDGKYGNEFLGWSDFLGRNLSTRQLPAILGDDFKGHLSEAAPILELNSSNELGLKYQSYEEAKVAAQALNIKSSTDYKKTYKIDPCLPDSPERKYGNKFLGWRDFLNKKKYQTYEEAKVAAQALKIKSLLDYNKKYKMDPLLPASPSVKYRKEFLGWANFLGTANRSKVEIGKEKYQTYEDASYAARALKFQSRSAYMAFHHKDSKLPSNPKTKYGKDFLGWGDFLGTDYVSHFF